MAGKDPLVSAVGMTTDATIRVCDASLEEVELRLQETKNMNMQIKVRVLLILITSIHSKIQGWLKLRKR
jgi:hypothetical protein